MSYKVEEDKEILELQKLYIKGKIKEEDIPEEQLKKLKELYCKQIKYLEDSIEEDRKKILKLKKKI